MGISTDEYLCNNCGEQVFWNNLKPHYCKSGRGKVKAWPEFVETRKAEALERIANSLERLLELIEELN